MKWHCLPSLFISLFNSSDHLLITYVFMIMIIKYSLHILYSHYLISFPLENWCHTYWLHSYFFCIDCSFSFINVHFPSSPWIEFVKQTSYSSSHILSTLFFVNNVSRFEWKIKLINVSFNLSFILFYKCISPTTATVWCRDIAYVKMCLDPHCYIWKK